MSGTGVDTLECVFDKRRDVLVWGGAVLVTDPTGQSIFCPLSGTLTSVLVRLQNPAGNIVYTAGNVVPASAAASAGFVPLESMFAVWQNAAKRPVYWPIPIAVPKGGSLQMDMLDLNTAGTKHIRFTFWTSIMYEEREVA